jgi:hypothetical protein
MPSDVVEVEVEGGAVARNFEFRSMERCSLHLLRSPRDKVYSVLGMTYPK